MKEETGMIIRNPKWKGNMTVEYPDRIFVFDTFFAQEFEGEPQDCNEDTSEWIEIDALLQKPKIVSNMLLLDPYFRKALLQSQYQFKMKIKVEEQDDQEIILAVDYEVEEKK